MPQATARTLQITETASAEEAKPAAPSPRVAKLDKDFDGVAKSAKDSSPESLAQCCPFQEAINLLGRRHAMTIIWLLQQGEPRRFNQMKRILGINPVSLSQRLDELEAAGVVNRQTYNTVPPKVEYRLTPKGRDLLPLMDQMSAWAKKHDAPANIAPIATDGNG